jgi:hypothetical protein
VKVKARGESEEKRYTGRLEMPADVYNGMVITIAKNLSLKETQRVHVVAFTPKPMLIEVEYAPASGQRVMFGTRAQAGVLFTLKPKLGTITGFLANLTGKDPPDSHAWFVTEHVPAFVRFQGPLVTGPVWRIDLIGPNTQ